MFNLGIIWEEVSVFLLAWWECRDAAQCTNHYLRDLEHHNHDADHKGEGLLMLSLRNERSQAVFTAHQRWCSFCAVCLKLTSPFSQMVKGGISETRIEKRIVITGDSEIDHDKVQWMISVWCWYISSDIFEWFMSFGEFIQYHIWRMYCVMQFTTVLIINNMTPSGDTMIWKLLFIMYWYYFYFSDQLLLIKNVNWFFFCCFWPTSGLQALAQAIKEAKEQHPDMSVTKVVVHQETEITPE